ncbi:hypothetical protein [Hymenobacter baengnokdamensis]|uniref:hypothetical protein n=1 Tax=Hymenobacter baengnokdamensis TaxID=2615203 RepID=UPI00124921AD|nr:hypothetical protein [Hymenobacter baengnokdamensis]
MDAGTKDFWTVVLSAIQTIGVGIGALWAYFRFWREGAHKPRIEFDIQCSFLGQQGNARVVSFTILATNKGNIEHKFSRISLRARGITAADGELIKRPDGRVNFPKELLKEEVIPKEFGYYFVRPGIAQPLTFTTIIPAEVRLLLVRAAFEYERSKDLHTSERTFEVLPTTSHSNGYESEDSAQREPIKHYPKLAPGPVIN